ncbi:MAG TPA: formate/nitrite transporter family protein [Pseudogracilibacillus sp.]|nr:formate/nitrite transporter family protein [Pseudogracilibacillus sp.]
MDYIRPNVLINDVALSGKIRSELSVKEILLRGFLAGVLLSYATILAFTAAIETDINFIGALVFPAGFVMVTLLGLELVTGSFALMPIARLNKQTTTKKMFHNFSWAFIGNLIGGLFFALLFSYYIQHTATSASLQLIEKVIANAEGKTIVYQEAGRTGMIVLLIKAFLCNWMVTMGVIMSFTSSSTIGKTIAMWLPILIFFALGFEHAVVNMFIIPAGMLLGADVTLADWWVWNQIPVTIGNFISGFFFTGFLLHYMLKK